MCHLENASPDRWCGAVVRSVSAGGTVGRTFPAAQEQKGKNTTCVTLKMMLAVASTLSRRMARLAELSLANLEISERAFVDNTD